MVAMEATMEVLWRLLAVKYRNRSNFSGRVNNDVVQKTAGTSVIHRLLPEEIDLVRNISAIEVKKRR